MGQNAPAYSQVASTRQPARETCTVEDAAARLDLSRTAAYDLIRRNEFPVPFIRLGRKIVIPVRALDRLLMAEDSASPLDGAHVA